MMPSAADHKKSRFVKFLLVGNSGAGKTGALAPLVEAGYDLRIVDFDSGLDSLISIVRHKDPALLGKIGFNTFRDKMQMSQQGPKVVGAPKAYVSALKSLERWPDDESDPSQWGEKTILVIDSLTNAGLAALRWAKGMNPSAKDPRQWYSAAQDIIQDLVANITDDSFETNVIVISHIDLIDTATGTKGYASSIGKALGPKLPRFFNTMVLSETTGSGTKVKRKLKTVPTAFLDLKTGAPFTVKEEYDILDGGMVKLFEDLKAS
jgi:hypothetical protein